MTDAALPSSPRAAEPTLADLSAKIDELTIIVLDLAERLDRPRRRRRKRELVDVAGIRFTARQREVLMAVGAAAGNIAEAARELNIDPSVCHRHYQRALAKARKAGVGLEVKRGLKLAAPSRATRLPAENVLGTIDGQAACRKNSLSRQAVRHTAFTEVDDRLDHGHDFSNGHDGAEV